MTAALQNNPQRSALVTGRVPLGRWGEAGDVAGAVAFLAGDAAHQYVPTGGYGMNTGVGDAFDYLAPDILHDLF